MEWLPILEFILWLIICALMLIFIYIMFAITLILIVLGFSIIIPFLIFYCGINGGELNIKSNSFTIQKDTNSTSFKYGTSLEKIDFFAFKIPTIYLSFTASNITFDIPFNFFTSSIPSPPIEIFENFLNSEGNETAQNSGLVSYNELQQFLVGLTGTLGIFGAIFSFTAALLKVSNAFMSILLLSISGLSLIISIISLITYTRTIDYMTPSFGIGLMIAFILGLFALGLILTQLSYVNPVWIFLITIIGLTMSLMKIGNVLDMIITQDFEPMKNPSIILGVYGFTLGTMFMFMVEPDKRSMSVLFMLLFISIILFVYIV